MGLELKLNLLSPIIEKWDKALRDMLKDSEVISKLKNVGAIPFYHNSSATREYVMKDSEEVGRLWSGR